MQTSLHKNTALILTVAVALGFILPEPAAGFEPLVMPALFLMMAFSMAGLRLELSPPIRGAAVGFLLNYLFLSGLISLFASVLLEEGAFWLGLSLWPRPRRWPSSP